MRKILSALLAVMMLVGVLAALPVFADDQTIEPVKTIDGTIVLDFADANLVVTEIMTNSKSNLDKYNDIADTLSTSKTSSKDHFDYIEIYNKGTEAVNLYDYCLLRRSNTGIIHQYETEGTFDRQNYIAPGTIYQNAYGVNPAVKKTYSDVINPNAISYDDSKPASEQLHWLQPGQFAVIWFWNGDNDSASTDAKKSMAAPDDKNYTASQNGYYFPQFREHYNVSDDTIVLAVYGQNNATYAPKCFGLDNGSAYMYAIADKDFDVAEPAIENVGTNLPELNEKIESLFCWGLNTKAGIPTNDGTDHQATNYMPAIAAPDLWNADEKAVNKEHNEAQYFDYVQTGHCLSYKEMAIFKYAEEPTVGSMPLYQWAYVHPEGLMNHWDDLKVRADAELDVVVRAKVYAIVEKEITDAVNNDGGIVASQKPGVIAERLAAAAANGGEIDQRTDARLADPTTYGQDLQEHYVDLLKTYICDYDEAMGYKVTGSDELLLIDANGDLYTNIEGGAYVWVSRLTKRFVELNKYVLVDAEEKDEELNEPPLVDREELKDKYENGNAPAIKNRGQVVVDGQTYTKYTQGSKEYYLGADGKFYTMSVTEIPAVTETVNKLSTVGLVGIIAAAVVVVAGIAVAVILVAKKKNKPVAADDVAAEGAVEVIDESNNQQ